jgi:exodeoxyribonuclease-5
VTTESTDGDGGVTLVREGDASGGDSATTTAVPTDLTEHQQEAFRQIYERLDDGSRYTSLRGYAGTGKTYLVGRLIDQFEAEDETVTACAPTHKAAHVLDSKIGSRTVHTQTLHSLLGLKLVPDHEGSYKLEPDDDRPELPEGVVIVDEASMIGKEEWHFIEKTPFFVRWLFVGDPAQLPPVGEKGSPVFNISGPMLEEVHRQGKKNPILRLATQVRQAEPFDPENRFEDGRGVATTESRRHFRESALRAFASEAFEKNATSVRILAYRNRTVRRYNRRVRAALYGDDAPRFEEGEWLVARQTWMQDGIPYLTSSEEMRVEDAAEDTLRADDGTSWKVWTLKVRGVRDGWKRPISVLHEDDRPRYEDKLDSLRDEALNAPEKWPSFYDLKERFAQVDYAYATTVHKSQGSTFDTVFVDHRDLQACRGPEKRALLYVAVTRPERRLALLL